MYICKIISPDIITIDLKFNYFYKKDSESWIFI